MFCQCWLPQKHHKVFHGSIGSQNAGGQVRAFPYTPLKCWKYAGGFKPGTGEEEGRAELGGDGSGVGRSGLGGVGFAVVMHPEF